jgi:GWxTD domain-containing protein
VKAQAWGALGLGVCLCAGCFLRPAASSLEPASRDFLSKARYLISRDERKAFLALPTPSDREAFIEDFWKKRDPDPETPANELKDEYYRRIDDAARLFREAGTPGWLTERGHLYVTLGPPDERICYPRGVTFYGIPTEVWYYNFFPIIFVDENWTGTFRLDPISAVQIGEINKTQVMLKPRVSGDSWMKDVDFEVQTTGAGEAVVQVGIPYKDIWLNLEGERMTTTLKTSIEVTDASGAKAWQDERSFPLSFSRAEFLKIRGETYLIKIPVRLAPGAYDLRLTLLDVFPGAKIERKAKLNI